MKGHLRQRGAGSFELKLDTGKDATGKRTTEYRSFKGTKREAQTELAKLIAAVGKGEHVARSTLTVGAHVAERIEQWVALGQITPKTAERYRELLANQIAPFIGSVALQALKTADIEKWHATLRVSGRRDGKGGLSALTIRHCHRLLGKSLKQAQRHDLVVRNVASMQPPPRVARAEVTILDPGQIRSLVRDLERRPVYPKAVLALFTGMRRGEILACRWQDFDLDRKTATVRAALEETKGALRFKTPKSEAGVREISLPDIVVETLRAYRPPAARTAACAGAWQTYRRRFGVRSPRRRPAIAARPLKGMGRGGGEHRTRRPHLPQFETHACESTGRRRRRRGQDQQAARPRVADDNARRLRASVQQARG